MGRGSPWDPIATEISPRTPPCGEKKSPSTSSADAIAGCPPPTCSSAVARERVRRRCRFPPNTSRCIHFDATHVPVPMRSDPVYRRSARLLGRECCSLVSLVWLSGLHHETTRGRRRDNGGISRSSAGSRPSISRRRSRRPILNPRSRNMIRCGHFEMRAKTGGFDTTSTPYSG